MLLTPITFGRNIITDFNQGLTNEWLITNGLGGYASSTIMGINNRKYHGLFVAALRPPGQRTIILSKLDEDIEVNGSVAYRFGANDFQNTFFPQGYHFLTEFSLSPLPTYTYTAENIELKKTLFLPFEKNSAVALYTIVNHEPNDITISVYPLLPYRINHHVINNRTNPVRFSQKETFNTVELAFDSPKSKVALRATNGGFVKRPNWVTGLFYSEERNRGESSLDEAYQPGHFKFEVKSGSVGKFAITTIVTDQQEASKALDDLGLEVSDIEALLGRELNRRATFLETFYNAHNQIPTSGGLSWLLQAANDFIIKGKEEHNRFIIAGYPWFGSWGRDTFVSLPGLLLVYGRFEEAKDIILSYTKYCKQGLIPNLIDEISGELLYNTADGTLWYINSILQYLKYTEDFEFIKKFLWPTLVEIIENYKRGTANDIRVDNDGLLAHGPQLTWMDTVVEGSPYTPRAGKAIEIQALWYNALRTIQLLAKHFNEENIAADLSIIAEHAKENFNQKFWNADQNCLFDVIAESGTPDYSLRPNQIIACALDFTMVNNERASRVVDFVQSELLTPVGLRTLSPKDPRYRGKYEGDRTNRDKAYHSGSIWPWLTGPFITAYIKAKGSQSSLLQYANDSFMSPLLKNEIYRGGIGTINEIYDGDPPYTPRGCIAQAWSVAEPLRALIEDLFQVKAKYESRVFGRAAEWLIA